MVAPADPGTTTTTTTTRPESDGVVKVFACVIVASLVGALIYIAIMLGNESAIATVTTLAGTSSGALLGFYFTKVVPAAAKKEEVTTQTLPQ